MDYFKIERSKYKRFNFDKIHYLYEQLTTAVPAPLREE